MVIAFILNYFSGEVSDLESEVQAIINEYVTAVNNVCRELLEGINAEENLNLKNKYDFFEYCS